MPRPRSATQPLEWDWMTDWAALQRDVRVVSQAVSWDWRSDLEDLHRQLDELEARVRGH